MSTGEPTKVDISEDLLNIRCVAQDRDEVCFRLKMTTPFQKMFDAYASQTKLNVASLRFLFDGTRINPTQSPGALKMEDGDTIDVYMEQVGGGSDSLVKDMKTFCKNKDFDMLTNEGKFGLSLAVTTLSAIGFEKRRIKANLEALRADLLDWWNTVAANELVKASKKGLRSVNVVYDTEQRKMGKVDRLSFLLSLPSECKPFMTNGGLLGDEVARPTEHFAPTDKVPRTVFEIKFDWSNECREVLGTILVETRKRKRQSADIELAADALLEVGNGL